MDMGDRYELFLELETACAWHTHGIWQGMAGQGMAGQGQGWMECLLSPV